MKSKLGYLTSVSLKRKIKTKWFLGANILLAVVIIGLINIDNIITFFGGDFNEKQKIHIIDNSDKSFETFKIQLETIDKEIFKDQKEKGSSYEFKLIEDKNTDYKKIIEENPKDLVVIFNPSDVNVIEATLVSEKNIDIYTYQAISTALNNTKTSIALGESDIPAEEISKLYSPIEIKREFLDESKTDAGELQQTIMSVVFPIFILPFFMLTIFLVQMIGAEVNEEKTTKGMEIIISNVSPKTHLFSKMIASNLFVIIQGGLLVLFAGLGLLLRVIIGGNGGSTGFGINLGEIISQVLSEEIVMQLTYIVPLTIVLMLLTFVAYSLLAGILASMTTNIEDFQQLQSPVVIILLIGYYLSMLAGLFEGSIFIKVFAFIPLISAILAPSLLLVGQIGIIEVLISILVMFGFNYLLLKYGLRIYKVGILNYSSSGLWKKMFKAIKE